MTLLGISAKVPDWMLRRHSFRRSVAGSSLKQHLPWAVPVLRTVLMLGGKCPHLFSRAVYETAFPLRSRQASHAWFWRWIGSCRCGYLRQRLEPRKSCHHRS